MTIGEKLFSVLSHTEWKRGLQLIDEIAAKFGKRPSYGSVISAIERMIREGWVETKAGDDPAVLAQRGGNAYRVFRLTSGGIRRRHELDRLGTTGPIGGALEEHRGSSLAICYFVKL